MARKRSYVVVVQGTVDRAVADSLAPLTVSAADGETTISGEALDAAMLSGALRTVEQLGLELVAVHSFVNEESA
jgi:hypothetical protein